MKKNNLLLGTRKGLIVFKKKNGQWKFSSDHFPGIPVTYSMKDERNGRWWACLEHGHWGCKLHYSDNEGKSWKETDAPKYPESEVVKDKIKATLKYLWCMSPGGNDQPKRLYIGTVPGGLFVSDNNGKTFELIKGLWNHPSRKEKWFGGGMDQPGIHSILINPKDSDHIMVGISCAGVFETTNGGKSWEPVNKGLKADFLPDPDSEVGQDPHLVVASPTNFKMLWQQNHCGIFKSDNGAKSWNEISEKKGIANFGFAIEADEIDENVAWVVPAISDEIRIAINGALCVCRTDDGGKSWKAFRNGLPQKNCYDIAFRHALSITGNTLAFGTTTGNLFLSENRGEKWQTLSNTLPLIHSLKFIS